MIQVLHSALASAAAMRRFPDRPPKAYSNDRLSIYIPEEFKSFLNFVVELESETKSNVVRKAVNEYCYRRYAFNFSHFIMEGGKHSIKSLNEKVALFEGRVKTLTAQNKELHARNKELEAMMKS